MRGMNIYSKTNCWSVLKARATNKKLLQVRCGFLKYLQRHWMSINFSTNDLENRSVHWMFLRTTSAIGSQEDDNTIIFLLRDSRWLCWVIAIYSSIENLPHFFQIKIKQQPMIIEINTIAASSSLPSFWQNILWSVLSGMYYLRSVNLYSWFSCTRNVV